MEAPGIHYYRIPFNCLTSISELYKCLSQFVVTYITKEPHVPHTMLAQTRFPREKNLSIG